MAGINNKKNIIVEMRNQEEKGMKKKQLNEIIADWKFNQQMAAEEEKEKEKEYKALTEKVEKELMLKNMEFSTLLKIERKLNSEINSIQFNECCYRTIPDHWNERNDYELREPIYGQIQSKLTEARDMAWAEIDRIRNEARKKALEEASYEEYKGYNGLKSLQWLQKIKEVSFFNCEDWILKQEGFSFLDKKDAVLELKASLGKEGEEIVRGSYIIWDPEAEQPNEEVIREQLCRALGINPEDEHLEFYVAEFSQVNEAGDLLSGHGDYLDNWIPDEPAGNLVEFVAVYNAQQAQQQKTE